MKPTPDKFMPSLYGGLLIATLWAVPGLNLLNCLCCAGVMLGGFLAVLLYQRELPPDGPGLEQRDCTTLGLLTAAVASVAAVVIQVLVTMVFGDVAVEVMLRLVERMNVEMPPEFYGMIEQAKEQDPTAAGSIAAMVVYFIPNGIFSVIGALIGFRVFGRTE